MEGESVERGITSTKHIQQGANEGGRKYNARTGMQGVAGLCQRIMRWRLGRLRGCSLLLLLRCKCCVPRRWQLPLPRLIQGQQLVHCANELLLPRCH